MITLFKQCILVCSLALLQIVGAPDAGLGINNGSLSPCPSPSHCARADLTVSDPAQALASLVEVRHTMPRVEVVEATERYVHATASSRLFGFVDDLELYAAPREGIVQMRSVSRLGESDLGVNRRRLMQLQQTYATRGLPGEGQELDGNAP